MNSTSTEQTTGSPDVRPLRAAHLILSLALGSALVGGLLGIRPPKPVVSQRPAPISVTGDVAAATTYTDLRLGPLGANRNWTNRVASADALLTTGGSDIMAEVVIPEGAKERSLAERSTRRAYNGAPPTIPHAVDPMAPDACAGCHTVGRVIGDRVAPAMPHEYLANCTQCHVPSLEAQFTPVEWAANTFTGLPAPYAGERAGALAPPVIPHSTAMRSNCLACHGPLGSQGLKSTHPWRQSCQQCHAPSATLNQAPNAVGERFLAPLPIVRPSPR